MTGIDFSDDVDWWSAQTSIDYLGTSITLESFASTLELALLVADQGSVVSGSDGSSTEQDCFGVWGGTDYDQ